MLASSRAAMDSPNNPPPMRRVLVLLNARAGTLIDRGADGLRERFAATFATDAKVDVLLLPPHGLAAAMSQVAGDDYDTIVIGGGDGSVNAAVNALAATDKTLGVLPCGTLNLLARDLGMPDDLDDAIAALARARPTMIDLASLNGRLFHSLSGLGFFSQMARAREEARDLPHKILRVGAAAIRALARSGRFSLELKVDGHRREVDAFAVLVTCNRFGARDWRRSALDGGALEIHIARDKGAFERLKAGAGMLTGNWRDSDGIESFVGAQATVASTRRRVWAATDGELAREEMPLVYAVRARALNVLAVPPS
jgi:diacylglycerol kinase family enzyme